MAVDRYTQHLLHAARLLLLLVASVSMPLGAIELLLRRNIIPNEYYLRNQVLGDLKRPGRLLFILGDSFMASIKGSDVVDYLYPTLAPHGVRIRNTATAGTGPLEYFENLRREGPRYRPDVVLLSYYVGNDLIDVGCRGRLDERLLSMRSPPAWQRIYAVQYLRERLRAMFPGRVRFSQAAVPGPHSWASMGRTLPRLLEPTSFHLSSASTFEVVQPFVVPLRGALPAANTLSHSLRVVQGVDYDSMKRAGIPEQYIESAKAGKLNPWVVNLGAQHPDYYRDELLMRSACAQRSWDDTKRVLDMILDEAAKLHAHVLPVIFPHTLQVDTSHYAFYRAWKIHVDPEMLETNRPQQLLREYFHAHGFEPLDLLDAFRSAGEPLYWDLDEHMNLRGQQLSARLIADAFLARYGNDGVR